MRAGPSSVYIAFWRPYIVIVQFQHNMGYIIILESIIYYQLKRIQCNDLQYMENSHIC